MKPLAPTRSAGAKKIDGRRELEDAVQEAQIAPDALDRLAAIQADEHELLDVLLVDPGERFLACRSWSSGPELTAAFGWYMTARDREERAAEIYARLVRRVGALAADDHNPAATLGAPTSGAR
jgi:hypothetical protein